MRRLVVSLSVFALGLSLFLPSAQAQFYTWTDEKGIVHMSDRKSSVPMSKAKEITGMSPPENTRTGILSKMLAQANANTRISELRAMAADYHRNHTYSMIDYFVCVDMALEMANMLKTKKFETMVVAGNVQTDTAGMEPIKMMGTFNHAWVVVTLAPGVYAAVETTGGFVADESVKNFEYYYQGLVFDNPRQAKETDVLIRVVNGDCQKARELVEDWNKNHAGRIVTAQALEDKGKLEAKLEECVGAKKKYAELIKAQYRKLY